MLGLGEGRGEGNFSLVLGPIYTEQLLLKFLSHFIHNLIAATSQAEEHLETGKSVFVMSQS